MQQIDIGTKIDLQDLLTSRMLIQANSGGGKSALARTIMEETYGKVPFIVIDYDGEYYTMKEKFEDILVIGGQYADVPLSMKSVRLLPREIIGNKLSVIIDVSDLKAHDRVMYVKWFLETMMELPKDYWTAYMVFIEESHKLCGEQDKQESATAVKDLMSRGRKMGYCGILITQRISKLHKDAAAECNNKFIGRTNLDLDMDRAAKELGFTSNSTFTRLSLRDLKPGTFYAYGTSIEPHHVHEVQIRMPKTKMIKAGMNIDIKPKKPTAKILAMLMKLNELPADAEKELKTIEQLKQEVNRLGIELKKKRTDNSDNIQYVKAISELRAKSREDEKRFFQLVEKAKEISASIQKIHSISSSIPDYESGMSKNTIEAIFPKDLRVANADINKLLPQAISPREKKTSSSNGSMNSGAMRMLKAAAMYSPNPITKIRMATLAGLSNSSGSFGTYIANLKREGWLETFGSDYRITDAGLIKAGDVDSLPTDPHDLVEMWCNNIGPGSGAARILRVLFNTYPDGLSKEQLGIQSEMSHTSGSFGTYLSILKRNGLVTGYGGQVKASEELFK